MSTILVTVDALRADRLAQYGYKRDTMPALNRLTADGTVFRNAFANAPYTRASVPAFRTSQYLAYDASSTSRRTARSSQSRGPDGHRRHPDRHRPRRGQVRIR